MKLAMLLVLASLAAGPSPASAQRADGGTAKGAPGAKDGETPSKRTKPRKGAAGKEPATSGASQAARAHARRVKSVYVYAAESCARAPDRCDQALLGDSDVRFMEACGACNTTARCEEERAAIRAGTARASKDPCAP